MTCGFKNSAGSDLDDIFYVDNGGSGALGYVGANSTSDLGDRYTSVTTLGTSVGYKAASGEEILGIRYNEALALECAYQRRLTEKLSERLSALESVRP